MGHCCHTVAISRSRSECGSVEAFANLVLVYAFRDNLTSVVAPVVAVYPAVTVVLARVVLGEHLGWVRSAGLALTLFGLVLIATG